MKWNESGILTWVWLTPSGDHSATHFILKVYSPVPLRLNYSRDAFYFSNAFPLLCYCRQVRLNLSACVRTELWHLSQVPLVHEDRGVSIESGEPREGMALTSPFSKRAHLPTAFNSVQFSITLFIPKAVCLGLADCRQQQTFTIITKY